MPDESHVARHYTHGALLEAIRAGVERLGLSEASVTVEDLGPVEEFHIGGRQASADFLDQLSLTSQDRVLDVGCGLGGVARFAASRYGSHVTGIDLTAEYVETGRVLTGWVGLQDRVLLQQGSATAMVFPEGSFDKAYMMHVGMNIADKQLLMSQLYRVLRPGGRLGIYDVMRISEGELVFPVPWASEPDGSAVASLNDYEGALVAAGFSVAGRRNRHDFALSFLDKLQQNSRTAGAPPPLGLHIVMGANAAQKIGNMVHNVRTGVIAPVEVIATKDG